MSSLTLLGPQREHPSVSTALGRLGIEGPVCAITAGWQEREGELDELALHVTRPVTDLRLYQRGEEVFEHDRELFDAHRKRQLRVKELQRLYRMRLAHSVAAAREVLAADGDAEILHRERRAAISAVRALDRYHIRGLRAEHLRFESTWRPTERASVATMHTQLARIIESSAAVLIAGGHVSVLLNRLRMFGLGPMIATRPIIAWSAGAMALSERVVLFHDSPPQGRGNAEVIDEGLGIARRIVPLPHASARLDLDDPVRVSLFARRFSPAACMTLDPGAMLIGDGDHWDSIEDCLRLTSRGRLTRRRPRNRNE